MSTTLEREFAIPHETVKNEEFANLFFQRAKKVKEEMPEIYQKVYDSSHSMLNPVDDFQVFVCPLKVMRGERWDHPILLTYCKWGNREQMFYWPMDMIPLTNDEREYVWYKVVKDDNFYYQSGEYFNFN